MSSFVAPKKYIMVNGVMTLNPALTGAAPTTVANPKTALAIISTPQDIMDSQAVSTASTGKAIPMANSTQASLEILMDGDYASQLGE